MFQLCNVEIHMTILYYQSISDRISRKMLMIESLDI